MTHLLFGPQIIGHSLGGGTAALLTYILRERQELSTATCVAFASGSFLFLLSFFANKDLLSGVWLMSACCLLPLLYAAACMTWELAESGNDCITCVINGADLVPTFSAASVDDLRAEVLL